MTQPERLTEEELMRLDEWQKKREVAKDWAKRVQKPLNDDEIKELTALLVQKNRVVQPALAIGDRKDPYALAEYTLIHTIAEDMLYENRERIEHLLAQHWLAVAHSKSDPVEEKAARLDYERLNIYLEEFKRGWRASDGHIGAG